MAKTSKAKSKKAEDSKKIKTTKTKLKESKIKTIKYGTKSKSKIKSEKSKTHKKEEEEKEEEEMPVVSKEIKKVPKNKLKSKKSFIRMTTRTKISNEDCDDFLKGKCNKLFCDKIHNYSKLYKKPNNISFLNNFTSLQEDFLILSKYKKKIYKDQELDIMFICDCTQSMGPWIMAVKKEIKNIISYIIKNNPYAKIKMSFLGYRDIKDKVRFEIQDFTDDFTSLENFISKINAYGSGDFPEDIAGALDKALKLSWRENSVKYCLLIADTPCNGKKYSNKEYEDDYPEGDPNGLNPELLISEFAIKNIILFFIKINNDNDKMNEIFNNCYIYAHKEHKPILIAELEKSTEKLGFTVSVTSNEALNRNTSKKLSLDLFNSEISKKSKKTPKISSPKSSIPSHKKFISYKTFKTFKTKVDTSRTFDDFVSSEKNSFNAVCHSFIIKKDRHMNIDWKNPYISHYTVNTKCIIDKIPFNEGALRYAYYLYDEEVKMKYVAKLDKEIDNKRNNLKGYSRELESITICHHISNEFDERIVNIVPNGQTNILLKYVHCYIYQITSPSSSHKYYYVENYIPGQYIKYNNNTGWTRNDIAEQTLVAQAFSHFSYQYTQGYLMIVDLQGVGGFLTDPQIHCLDEDRFGVGNLGYTGFIKFFLTHNCNKYCKALGLVHPNIADFKVDIDNFDFFVEKYEEPKNKNDEIYTICDLCRKPFKINALKALDLRKKCWDPFCDECDGKRKKNLISLKCDKCGSNYRTSPYIWTMKRQPFPNMCQKCEQEDKNENRNKYYNKKKIK